MARWPQIKAGTSRRVHETFSWPANYRRASSGATISDVSIRLHLKNKVFGDLDREGYATVVEDVKYAVIDTIEIPNPVRGDTFFVPDINRTYRLNVAEPNDDGGDFQRWEIVEVPNT